MSHHLPGPDCPLCREKLETAHPFMRAWFLGFVKPKHPDCHVAWAYRDQANQEQAFKEGKSRCHYPNGPHNRKNAEGKAESYALDLFEINDQGAAVFNTQFYARLAHECDEAKEPILWGGTFKSLGDYDHFQYRPT